MDNFGENVREFLDEAMRCTTIKQDGIDVFLIKLRQVLCSEF